MYCRYDLIHQDGKVNIATPFVQPDVRKTKEIKIQKLRASRMKISRGKNQQPHEQYDTIPELITYRPSMQ